MTPSKHLSRRELHDTIAAHVERAAQSPIRILEAGCGRGWPFKTENIHLTGVDMDPVALEHRSQQDLDAALLGDLRSIEFPTESFDIIYNAFVLEHVDGAQKILDSFVRWLKPGGLMILTFPNRDSVYGFFTRITPLWFHVAYKRYIKGNKDAGKPGHAPYATFYDKILSRKYFLNYVQENHLSVITAASFGQEPRFVTLFMQAVQMLTMNALDAKELSLLYVLEKPRGCETKE